MASQSEAIHAAGPWTLDESTGSIVDALGMRVAKVPIGTAEERANARLVAASPMLYDALLELTGQIAWANLGSVDSIEAALTRAGAALAAVQVPEDCVGGNPVSPEATLPPPFPSA